MATRTTEYTLSTGARGPRGLAGADGADGSDASVTTSNVATALGLNTSTPVIDDDTMAAATATNVPSAESVKAYVDAIRGLPALTAANIIAALNIPSYASLALANANETIGTIFWNSTDLELQIATA